MEYSKPLQVTDSFTPPSLRERISHLHSLVSSLGVSLKTLSSSTDHFSFASEKSSIGYTCALMVRGSSPSCIVNSVSSFSKKKILISDTVGVGVGGGVGGSSTT